MFHQSSKVSSSRVSQSSSLQDVGKNVFFLFSGTELISLKEDFTVTLLAVFHLVIIAPRCSFDESTVLLSSVPPSLFRALYITWSRWDVLITEKNRSLCKTQRWNIWLWHGTAVTRLSCLGLLLYTYNYIYGITVPKENAINDRRKSLARMIFLKALDFTTDSDSVFLTEQGPKVTGLVREQLSSRTYRKQLQATA